MQADFLKEAKRTVSALYPELAGEPLFRTLNIENSFVQTPVAEDMKTRAKTCIDCELHVGRRNSVYGDGSAQAKVIFIGDFPSPEDDNSGKIFSDAAGALLERMIVAMNLAPQSVYKTNLVKCRPPKDRTPQEREVRTCQPYMDAELNEIGAAMIVALGEAAGQFFSRTDASIEHLRGKWFDYEGTKVMVTHHPRTLMSTPAKKKDAWADLQLVMKELN